MIKIDIKNQTWQIFRYGGSITFPAFLAVTTYSLKICFDKVRTYKI
jgi:hypothetical protein